MKVRRLDKENDWTFGRSKSDYIGGQDAVMQNVATRIKSFKNDWFLDTEANIDWHYLLGTKDTEQLIINEITEVVKNTEHVVAVSNISIDKNNKSRVLTVKIQIKTVFNDDFAEQTVEV